MVDTHSTLVLNSELKKKSYSFKEFADYCYSLLMNSNVSHEQYDPAGNVANSLKHGPIIYLELGKDCFETDDDDANTDNYVVKISLKDGKLSMPFDLSRKILKFPLVLFRSPSKVIYKPSKMYEKIKANLTHYQDNGDFGEFDTYAKDIVTKHKDCYDIVATVKIEQARSARYKGEFTKAQRFAREAQKVAQQTQFPTFFDGQVLLVLSSIFRNMKNKLGEANRYLEEAEQCFESVYSIEVLALFHEQRGSYFDTFLGKFATPDENVKKLALTSFKKMGEIGSQHSRQHVSDKKRFYAMIKSARILLDSNSLVGRRERIVTKDSVHQAAECVKTIKCELLGDIPRGSRIQFQLVESDLYYRKGNFEDAMKLLNETLNEAKELGYKTECPKITQVMIEMVLDHNRELSSKNKLNSI